METQVVEIRIEEEQQQFKLTTAIQHHPLAEISQSPGHLLLLKLWQREDDLFARRIAIRETRIHTLRREISHLCCSFLLFHGLFLTLLFTSSVGGGAHRRDDWWVPSSVSLATSAAIVTLVQAKLRVYWRAQRQLERERCENRALARLVQELRMKGASFDLSKEMVKSGKRMKSSSVEIRWRPVEWCRQYAATICLACFAAFMFPASKLILCVF